MGTVHIALKDGTQQEVDEEELSTLWAQAQLPSTALYWQPGMDNWEPLVGYFAGRQGIQVQPVAEEPVASARRYRFRKDPRVLTLTLLTLLGIGLGTAGMCFLTESARLLMLQGGDLTMERAEFHDTLVQVAVYTDIAVFIVTGFFFLKWIYRANLNSHGFGAQGMKFTPGWCIGWYFIPFLCLVRPYQSMREIWQVSADPENWSRQPGSYLLGFWWTFWLIASIYDRIIPSLADRAETLESVIVFSNTMISYWTVRLILQGLALALVFNVSRRQRALVDGVVPVPG